MIRNRHVAGAVAVALLSLPFIGASPAKAAGEGTASVTGPLYTGNTETITLVDGTETGAYKVELWQTAKVATIKTGADITAIGSSLKWTIPTGVTALVGTSFKVKIVAGTGATFADIETGTFDIESSKVDTITGQGASWSAGVTKTITWDNKGQTGDKVDISIVSGAGKTTALKKATANDETESITLPLSVAAATGYKLKITPSNKAAAAGESAAVEVTAATAPSIAFDDASVEKGQEFTVTPTSASGPVKLDLVLKSAPTKVLANIAKSAASGGDVDYVIPAKLAAGTYSVIATVIGSKPAVTTTSGDLTVSAFPAITLDSDTTDALAAGVTTGQSVKIIWASGADTGVTVSYLVGDKVTKLDAKEVTEGGDGSYTWVVGSKLAAGSTYKVQVSNNDDPTVLVQSSAFTVSVNTTTLAS